MVHVPLRLSVNPVQACPRALRRELRTLAAWLVTFPEDEYLRHQFFARALIAASQRGRPPAELCAAERSFLAALLGADVLPRRHVQAVAVLRGQAMVVAPLDLAARRLCGVLRSLAGHMTFVAEARDKKSALLRFPRRNRSKDERHQVDTSRVGGHQLAEAAPIAIFPSRGAKREPTHHVSARALLGATDRKSMRRAERNFGFALLRVLARADTPPALQGRFL